MHHSFPRRFVHRKLQSRVEAGGRQSSARGKQFRRCPRSHGVVVTAPMRPCVRASVRACGSCVRARQHGDHMRMQCACVRVGGACSCGNACPCSRCRLGRHGVRARQPPPGRPSTSLYRGDRAASTSLQFSQGVRNGPIAAPANPTFKFHILVD